MWYAVGFVAVVVLIGIIINSQGLKWLTIGDNPKERDDA